MADITLPDGMTPEDAADLLNDIYWSSKYSGEDVAESLILLLVQQIDPNNKGP